ncbi:bifunctional UDP-N-acetylglucosamine diphosphorylase/glucosamine-1-phosphate N-acetyltransferase GlmU [bacterium]|nr:bifunctional UDP-N-acetylglucosamine diphosphorylase/glucosamine-1-phosphate N-acetyltransferase GlmU [bacterium]MCI0605732.1 bifunctional UDP-N-acetylglucosamine diphosphorylase/glucosamine-1-phosphate N-acetyltransferase GlmU [bacterium]
MKSKLSKLLHPLCGKPLILHVQESLSALSPTTCAVVVGHQRDQIMDALKEKPVDFVVQEQQKGTAHAVSEFLKHYPSIEGLLLVLSGDTPLLQSSTLLGMIQLHQQRNATITLLTTEYDDPTGYGRVIRSEQGTIQRIVEEADANETEKAVREVNAGIYVFDVSRTRELLPLVQAENKQKEYYLPDLISLALERNWTVLPQRVSANEVMGINTKVELADAHKTLRKRINQQWMLRGVTIIDPATTYIDTDVQFGTDVVLHPNIYLEGSTLVGSEVTIYPNCRISDSYIDSRCVIYENSSIDTAHLEAGVKVGPFARIRPDTYLQTGVRIGNFVELKKSFVGEGTKANHLSYLGDATIGKNVNIGAGTITCNYDGEKKHPTVIEDDVFIGSDTQLIAPVKVKKGAYVAAGSSITEDVPENSMAIARGRQVNKPGWKPKKK